MLITESFNGFNAPCVYKLVFPNGIYVGSTKNYAQRIQQHFYAMRSGRSFNKLNDAWEKYKSFDAEVIEYIDSKQPVSFLRQREEYWIEQLKPELNGGAVPVGMEDQTEIKKHVKRDKEEQRLRKEKYRMEEERRKAEHAKKYKSFENDSIGSIRATLIDGSYWIVGCDLAFALGYHHEASTIIRKYVSYENTCITRSNYGISAVHINDIGVREFISNCKKRNANDVKIWYESEILPKLKEFEKDLNDRNSAA